ncbi:pentapeptide repeat-containing protein [Prescottella equi]|uniref:pentapeptide repeat-containing protein n=1 Tax=Rhodococcus hoagii TaxID=43767 RepID=UPI001C84DFC4|nr:pentapeptide repeat-containing protein [Prescottella equi]
MGIVGYFIGRMVAIPGTTPFWDIAAQPLATLFAGIGAITAGCLAFYNGHKSRELDAAHHRSSSGNERESSLRERYTTAATQLADPNPAIREAGVYAIAALTDDWFRFGRSTDQFELAGSEQQVCLNLLCSYLRANRMVGANATSDQDAKQEVAVRRTVVAVLRERLKRWREQGVATVDLSGADLQRMDLRGMDLSGVDLTRANLHYAELSEANLERATLARAELTSARLMRANLRHARLFWANARDADFEGADLSLAVLSRAELFHANLTDCVIADARLYGTRLADAILTSADLSRATFGSVDFEKVDLSSCTLTGAQFSGISNLAREKLPTEEMLTGAVWIGFSRRDRPRSTRPLLRALEDKKLTSQPSVNTINELLTPSAKPTH